MHPEILRIVQQLIGPDLLLFRSRLMLKPAFHGTLLLLFQVGIFALGGGKSIAGLSGLSVDQSVLLASLVVALYLGSGGLMSSLLTDIFQGILSLTAFCFLVSHLTQEESRSLLNHFYCVMNTPIGQEAKLSAVGIHLPAMGEDRVERPEDLNEEALEQLYQSYAAYKVRGSNSSLELIWEPGLDWYYRRFIGLSASCFLLVLLLLWLGARLMAHLSVA